MFEKASKMLEFCLWPLKRTWKVLEL